MIKRYLSALILGLLSLCCHSIPYCDIRKFSILDGLAANTISDLCQGSDNIMWFATLNGLSYYDGYSFHTFRDIPGQSDILSTNRIQEIFPCSNYDLWCVTYDRHLYIYDTHICQFCDVDKLINEKHKVKLSVKKIYSLPNKTAWITTQDQDYAIRIIGKEFTDDNPEIVHTGKNGLPSGRIWFITSDKKGREWLLTEKGTYIYNNKFRTPIPFKWFRQVGNTIYLATTDGKLAVFDETRNHISIIPLPAGVTRINELKNTGFQLLIATNLGVVVYNPRTFRSEVVNVQNPNQPVAEVKKIYVDNAQKNIWAFTDGMGVTVINPNTLEKKWLFADQADPSDRTVSNKYFIMEDEHGTLWTIPNGGTFSYYDWNKKELVPYLLRSNSSGNYRIPKISKFVISDQSLLWVTGVHELTQINFKYHDYTLSRLDGGESSVRGLAIDHNHNYWDGFADGQIKISDEQHNKIGYITPSGQIVSTPVVFSKKGINALYEDTKGRMWIGTGEGIYLLQNGKVSHFGSNPQDPYSLPHYHINDIVSDRLGRIWIATYGGGLAAVDESTGSIRFISSKNKLHWLQGGKYGLVRRITCTSKGTILVGTTDGLVTFSDEFKNYSKIKYYRSFHVTNDTTSITANDVNFTLVRNNGDTYISSLGGTLAVTTEKNLLQNNLKIKVLKDINLDESVVQTMVEDNSGYIWIVRESSVDKYNPQTGTIDVFGPNDFDFNMTFTECRPIHAPSTDEITLGTPMGSITFNPKTLSKTTYQPKVLFTSLHYIGEKEIIPLLHRKDVVIPSNKRNLTISFASLDYTRKYQCNYAYRLEGSTPEGEWIQLGSQNMIGFNHIQPGKYTIKVKATNTHGIWSSSIAELPIEVEPTFWESIWGKIMMLLILSAGVGYAFYLYNNRQKEKLNHDMSVMKNDFFSTASHKLRTPLTLIGGPVTEVLNRETNLSAESKNMLTIVQRNAREMLSMLNEMLKFDNKSNFFLNKDSDAIFSSLDTAEEIQDSNAKDFIEENADNDIEENEKDGKDITILVVEDNADLRSFLHSILCKEYKVLAAENGKKGLEMTCKYVPDFILTDVTMPVMDGITMIHHIKQDCNISHIPIIVLSAKASVEDQLKGFEEGIDGYITKPFSATYLKGRIEAVINHHKALQLEMLKRIQPEATENDLEHVYPKEKEPEELVAGNSTISMQDETIRKATAFILENISDPDMKIDDIAQAMGMSRSVLYGKIKNAVGMTPIDFVRHLRIMKAIEKLENTNDTLTNIAFAVGFSDPKYFSKVFKKEMGVIPSDYRDRRQQSEN